MTLTLELTPEQDRRIREDAAREGLPTEKFVLNRALGEKPDVTPKPRTPEQIAKIKAARGFLVGLDGVSSEDFIAEKKREMELEDRF